MSWYVKGGSIFDDLACKAYMYLDISGYASGMYTNRNDSHMEAEDPYWRMGGSAGGAKESQFGLYEHHRIKCDVNGIYGWDNSSGVWIDLLVGGGGGVTDHGELTGLGDDDHPQYHNITRANTWLGTKNITDLGTKNHNDLSNLNAGVNYEHITQTQKNALHNIYTLEVHNNTYHNPDYKVDFSENTGFNKNFGTLSTEVCVGNDGRLSDARTPTAHVLATTGPHTGTLPWTDLNKSGSSLADLATRTHASLSDAPTSAHHVKYTTEEAQDAIGGILDDGTIGEVVFTYDDITPKISATVQDGEIDHNALINTHNLTTDIDHNTLTNYLAAKHLTLPNTIANVLSDHNLAAHTALGLFDQSSDVDHNTTTNYVADQHIAHSTISISPGAGMSGGGTIAANRTLTCTITQYTDALARTACLESTAYGDGWNGDNSHAPTQDAVYDVFNGKIFKKNTAFPTNPINGQLFYDTKSETLYRYSSDATAWIEIGGGASGNVSDEAYNADTWNTVIDIAPSKNAVRDKIELMDIDYTVFEGSRIESSIGASSTINCDFISTNNYTYHCLGINLYSGNKITTVVIIFYIYINSGWRKVYYYNLANPQHDYVQLYIPVLTRKCRITVQTGSGASAWFSCFAVYQPCVDAIYYNGHDY